MPQQTLTDTFRQTYNVHSGTDMVPTINGIVIGNLNGISFSTTREKSPVYTMGNVDPVAFGRGKRGLYKMRILYGLSTNLKRGKLRLYN